MGSNPPVKLKWLEHLNASWVTEDCEAIASHDGILALYDRLILNKEVVTMPQQMLYLRGPALPDFEHELISFEEQEHFINALLTSQLSLAKAVCSDSPFAAVLQKRLVVLQRIFYAVSHKYHDPDKIKHNQQLQDGNKNSEDGKTLADRSQTGTDALIEVGVKTGLSLLFSLLHQNWQLSSSLGCTGICNHVIRTAADVIKSLTPLSLSNENKLPPLGLETLNQVTQFLRNATLPNSGADVVGKCVFKQHPCQCPWDNDIFMFLISGKFTVAEGMEVSGNGLFRNGFRDT
jgi:E3 ubiquitin-protein ligase HERC1